MKKCLIIVALNGVFTTSHALEIQPGDYEMLPENKSFMLAYYTTTHSSQYYLDGHKFLENAHLDTQVAMFRYIYAYPVKENIRLQPQVILPMAKLETSGDVSYLGHQSATGDLIAGMPILFTPDTLKKSVLNISPFITLPTGSYNHEDALNVGENRWNVILQAGWLYHFYPGFTLENIVDATFYGPNDKYGTDSSSLKQQPRYEYQLYLRYNLSPGTSLGIGGGWVGGAESKINGIRQNDQLDTRYAKVTISHFFTPRFQLNMSLGKDLSVQQGFKQDTDFSMRLGYLF